MLCRVQQLQRGAWTRQVTVRFCLLLAHQRITVGTFSLEPHVQEVQAAQDAIRRSKWQPEPHETLESIEIRFNPD